MKKLSPGFDIGRIRGFRSRISGKLCHQRIESAAQFLSLSAREPSLQLAFPPGQAPSVKFSANSIIPHSMTDICLSRWEFLFFGPDVPGDIPSPSSLRDLEAASKSLRLEGIEDIHWIHPYGFVCFSSMAAFTGLSPVRSAMVEGSGSHFNCSKVDDTLAQSSSARGNGHER